MKVKKVDLQTERQEYSQKMQDFEKEFTYPLGNQSFSIQHGTTSDYFTFFEGLGEVHFLVIEDNNKVVGAICAVLKDTWYLCDFKISQAYRGKKLYRKLMLKYFLPLYLKNQTMFAVNMSPPSKNKIFTHTQRILKYFNIQIESRYLSQFTGKDLSHFNEKFWKEHYIVTNNGNKDIVIEGKCVPLYHIVNKQRKLNGVQTVTEVPADSQVMLVTSKKLNMFPDEIEISLIHKGNPNIYFSSAEI